METTGKTRSGKKKGGREAGGEGIRDGKGKHGLPSFNLLGCLVGYPEMLLLRRSENYNDLVFFFPFLWG